MTRCSRRLLCSLFLAAAALCGVTSAAAPRLGHHLPVHVPGLRPQAGRHHQLPHTEPHHQRRLEGQYRHQHQELAADGERRHPLA
uniref:Secreted protein n=1 Tax=Oryza meridionalis TaxID=40149 RepID=A0A0E0FBH0_9ORYZ